MTSSDNTLPSLFSLFTSGAPAFSAPTYQADPTGMMAESRSVMTGVNNNFNENYGLMRTQVQRLNDPAFLKAQRDARTADVQRQADASYGIAVRDMTRRGVNPNSGAFAALTNQRALQTALGKASAAATSDKDMRSAYMSGLSGLNGMNGEFGKLGLGYTQTALDANKTANNFGLQTADLNLKANGGGLDWARLGMDKYRADKGLEGTQYTSDAANDVDWGALAAGSLLNNKSVWNYVFGSKG